MCERPLGPKEDERSKKSNHEFTTLRFGCCTVQLVRKDEATTNKAQQTKNETLQQRIRDIALVNTQSGKAEKSKEVKRAVADI